MNTEQIVQLISQERFPLDNEKVCQTYIEKMFIVKGLDFTREYCLDKHNIPDFFNIQTGLAIEVKTKGSVMDIFRQCQRYLGFKAVKSLILVTNKGMGFPGEIEGKPCYVINMGKAWL
jgi:hypothetical protein